jgi:dihydroorotase
VTTVLLRQGRVIDPSAGRDATLDLLITDGRVTALSPVLDPIPAGTEVIDCRDLVVSPGLIDMHTHVFEGLGDFCVNPDAVGVDMGVPVVVDGGTSGVATFDISRRAVIDNPETRSRVLAFVDPCQLYLATKDFICHKLRIADDLLNLDADSLAACISRNADVLVGLKVRACHVGDPEYSPFLAAAQEASRGMPVMVHLGRFPHTPVITPAALLRQLRPGDIITHAFRGAGGMLAPDGKAIPEFRDAVDRGVVLDMGHSGTDFRFREARRLMDQGYLPNTASTDLNIFTLSGPVFSLAENLTKLLALGLSLPDVIAMATTNVARAIGRMDALGSLDVGHPAEVSVFRVRDDGPFPVSDGHEVIASTHAVEPVGCVRGGTWIPSKAVASFATHGRTWQEPPPDQDW